MSALEARIMRVVGAPGAPLDDAPPFDDDSDDWDADGAGAAGDEEEEVVEVDEAQVLALLDAAEPALQVCRRLFRPSPPLDALRVLPAWAAASLHRVGWTVLPAFLPVEAVQAAREEALGLQREGAFSPAPAHAHFTDASARGDAVLWLRPGASPALGGAGLAAALAALTALRADLATLLTLRADSAEHQLAVYPPNGAGYARHRDAFPDDGAEVNQRRVTAVLYLNDADWDASAAGGALRLHVPPVDAAGEREPAEAAALRACCVLDGPAECVSVVPAGGTLALFLSGVVEHEVMPCYRTRVALTAWCQ